MWKLAFGVALTFVSSWFLEGGMRRRARRTIREELELAELLDVQNPEMAVLLRARAEARMNQYLTPLFVKLQRWAPTERLTLIVGVLTGVSGAIGLAALAVSSIAALHLDNAADVVSTSLAIGAVGTATYVVLTLVLVPLVERLAKWQQRKTLALGKE